MIELEKDQYLMVEHFLKSIACDTTTAYSIIENRQQGRVFVDDVYSPKTVLFWHYCSFALLAGDTTNEEFNQNLGKLLLGDFENNQKRFALFVNDDKWNNVITNITHNNPQIKSIYFTRRPTGIWAEHWNQIVNHECMTGRLLTNIFTPSGQGRPVFHSMARLLNHWVHNNNQNFGKLDNNWLTQHGVNINDY